jgi:glycosyltransferase involved in cell wall biosynthesis
MELNGRAHVGWNLSLEEPKVSVLIPTYNAGASISSCLTSVRNQSYSGIEVIVVDNLSIDATIGIAQAFGARVIKRKSTPASARNIGIVNSTGKYVFFVDSDQFLSRHVVEECATKCEEDNASMVRVPELFVGDGFWGSCSAEWKNYFVKVEQRYGAKGKILIGEPRFFSRELLVRAGMFNAALLWGEDYDLYQRLRETKTKEVSCRSLLYHFEPDSLRGIVTKNLRYGESMPAFAYRSRRQPYSRLLRHSLLTWGGTLADLSDRPCIALGCTLLLGLKSFAIVAGLVRSLA